ncbi:MAG: phenylalanine--tRNA ligase beta subunit-related protein [Candidatus Rehaiarchaeum fermentans]|nr:phenylalanine--tRNA ligase beta subunit-related protein [Candidatus Rehaiarchaeum fermentans]
MVVLDCSWEEIKTLVGEISKDELKSICFKYGLDVNIQDDLVSFEVTSERSDLYTIHSISFLINQIRGRSQVVSPDFDKIDFDVRIESNKRNKIILLVLELERNNPNIVKEIAQLTDKTSDSLGRRRKIAGVGAFDFDKIKPPLIYKKVDDISFVPLGFNKEFSLKEILENTFQGRTYDIKEYFAWFSDKDVVALVPIINADKFSVNENTKRILFEISGEDEYVVNNIATSILFNAKLLGKVYAIKGFEPKIIERSLEFDYNLISDLLGKEIQRDIAIENLAKLGFECKFNGNKMIVKVPFYRQDVISYADIADEILRLQGTEYVGYETPKTFNKGEFIKSEPLIEAIREILISLGFQEVDSSVLSSKLYQEDIIQEKGIRAGEFYLKQYIYPELIKFYKNNKDKEGPYYFFDIGYTIKKDPSVDVKYKNVLSLSLFIADEKRNVSWLVAILKEIASRVMNKEIKIENSSHPSFIEGRFAKLFINDKYIGLAGEIHPKILNELSLDLPVSVLEIMLE